MLVSRIYTVNKIVKTILGIIISILVKRDLSIIRSLIKIIPFHLKAYFKISEIVKKDDLIKCAKTFGIAHDETIFVHSSLSRLRYIEYQF